MITEMPVNTHSGQVSGSLSISGRGLGYIVTLTVKRSTPPPEKEAPCAMKVVLESEVINDEGGIFKWLESPHLHECLTKAFYEPGNSQIVTDTYGVIESIVHELRNRRSPIANNPA